MKKKAFTHFFYIMKLSLAQLMLVVLFCNLAAAESANGQKAISVFEVEGEFLFQDTPVRDALEQISNKTDFRFAYDDKVLKRSRVVSLSQRNLGEALTEISNQLSLTFRQVNNLIAVSEAQPSEVVKSVEVVIFDRQVQGTITDAETGDPLIGASVRVAGTSLGTMTDVTGHYVLMVPDTVSKLIVSYVGFLTKEVAVGEMAVIDVSLEPDVAALDEVVVVGYGTQKKENLTGAVVSVGSDELHEYSYAANVDQAIVGKLAGVNVLTNARNPGDGNTITIRGAGSITEGSDPLVVVDGFPLAEGSSLNIINVNDIASVNVIKDAASAAIYGSRAANGVIMITTKKGKDGKPTISLSTSLGVQERTGTYDLLNAYDAAVFFRDGRNNAYLKNHDNVSITDTEEERLANGANVRELILDYTEPYLDGEQGLTDFDWEDAVYRVGKVQNYYMNVAGGTDHSNYAVSLGYTDEEGIVITADQKRYTANIKMNTNINKYLKYGFNINGFYAQRGLTNGSNSYRFPIDPAGRAMVYMYPFFSAYDDSDPTGYNIEAQIEANRPYNANMQENPVAMAKLSKYERQEFNSFGNTYLSLEPIKNLVLKTSVGYLFSHKFTDQYAPMLTGAYRQLISERDTDQGSETRSYQADVLIENTANYQFGFGKSDFTVLLGQSFQKSSTSSLSVTGDDFTNDILENIAGSTTQEATASRSTWAQLSYFSRVLYNYDDTYFLTGSIRTDGSSRFGKDNRYGTFGSLSAGWVLSKEAFFPKNDIVTYAKLRYSWGQTGNNQIGNYAQYATMGTGKDYSFDGTTLSSGAGPTTAPAYNLSWETNTSNNMGVDLMFFDKISLGVDYYVADISDLLLDRPVPTLTGYDESLQNVGEMQNKGWEFVLNAANYHVGKVRIGVNANLTTNQNKIISLGGDEELYESTNERFITKVGHSLANLYGYKIIGLLKSEEQVAEYTSRKSTTMTAEVGDYIFQDTNHDDVIDSDDRVMLGDYKPELLYGFGFNLGYKGFDFSVNFNATSGRVAYDEMTSRYLEYGEAFTNTNYHYFNNYWDADSNPDGYLAPPDAYGNTTTRSASRNPTNYNVLDADYFRIRAMQLGYNVPQGILDRVQLQSLRVYVSASNLYTWTPYRGMNPDGGDSGDPLSNGHIEGTTAVPRIVSVGLNLTFQ